MLILARAMPQRTMQGATVHAWLAAYRRTLEKTLEQSRSMDQVIASRAVPWLETPDQAVVWGIALGLHEEVEDVLARSVELARAPAAASAGVWFPGWYVAGAGTVSGGVGDGGGGPSGMFSSSVLPDFGAMTAVLSTIGATAGSSGGGSGGGGFGGGGSSGGGGAGGGF
jgi:hypothetical protein